MSHLIALHHLPLFQRLHCETRLRVALRSRSAASAAVKWKCPRVAVRHRSRPKDAAAGCRRVHSLHTPASSARSFRQGEEACTWIWTRSTRPTSPLPSCLTRRKCDSRRSPSLPTSCRSLFQSGAPCDHTTDRKQACATSPSHALDCNFPLTCCTAAKTGLRVGLQGLGWQLRQYPAALGVSLANLSTGAHLAECWVRQLSPYRPRWLPASH